MTAPRTTYTSGRHPILKDARFARPQSGSITYHAQTGQQTKPKSTLPAKTTSTKFNHEDKLALRHSTPHAGSPYQAYAARMHGDHQAYLAHQAASQHDPLVNPTLVNFDVNLEYDQNAPRMPSADLRFVEGARLAMPADGSDYIGWDKSGFLRTDFDRRDGAGHTQSIEIIDRFGRITEFHFWDKSQGADRTPKIHDWDIKSPRTDEFRFFTQNGDGLKINCHDPAYEKYETSIFEKPLSDQIIVYTYDGNVGGPYEGCQIELILGCKNVRAGKKTFQHKVLVGLVVNGQNLAKGISSWRAAFNKHEWLANRPDSSKANWTFEGPNNESFTISLSDETKLFEVSPSLNSNDINNGYELLADPLSREDKVLVITPTGNFISVAAYEAGGKIHLIAGKPVFMLIPEITTDDEERFAIPLPNDDQGNARQLILIKKDDAWQAIKKTRGEEIVLTETSRRAKMYEGVFIVRPDKNSKKPSYHPPIGVFQIQPNGKTVTLAMVLEHDEATGYFSTAGQVSTTQWSANEQATLTAPPSPEPLATTTQTLPKKVPTAVPAQATSFTGDFNPFADDPTGQTGRLIIDLNGHGKLAIEGAKIQHDKNSTGDAENLELILDQLIGELIQPNKPGNENAAAVSQDGNRLFVEGVGTLTLVHADKISGHILLDVGFKAETIRPDGNWQDITLKLDPSKKAHADPLISGLSYTSLALPWVPPFKERQYFNPVLIMADLARAAIDTKAQRFKFISDLLGRVYSDLVDKTDPLSKEPIWKITLGLKSDGLGHLRPETQAHDGKNYTFIKELSYHFGQQRPDGSMDFRPISENEVFAEVIETETNSHGWAIKIDFAGRTLYLQPINPPSNRGAQTAVIGLSITTSLIPATDEQKTVFQKIMPSLDAYRRAREPEVITRKGQSAKPVTAPNATDNQNREQGDQRERQEEPAAEAIGLADSEKPKSTPTAVARPSVAPTVAPAANHVAKPLAAPVQFLSLTPPPGLEISANFFAVTGAYYRALFENRDQVIVYDDPLLPFTIEYTLYFSPGSASPDGQRAAKCRSIAAVSKLDKRRQELYLDNTAKAYVSIDEKIRIEMHGASVFAVFNTTPCAKINPNPHTRWNNESYQKYHEMHLWPAGLTAPVTKPEDYPPLILAQPTPEKMGREAWQGWRLPDGGKFEIKLEHKTERNQTRWSFARIQAGRTGTTKVRFQIGDMAKHATGETKAINLAENTDYQIVELSELSMQVILDRKTGTLYPLQPGVKSLKEAIDLRADWRPTKLPIERVAYHVGLRKLATTESAAAVAPHVAAANESKVIIASPSPLDGSPNASAPEPPQAIIAPVTTSTETPTTHDTLFSHAESQALAEIESTRAGFTAALWQFAKSKMDAASQTFLTLVRQFLAQFKSGDEKKKVAQLTIIQQGLNPDRTVPIEKATASLKAMLAMNK